ncbi:MAG: hypothetical protein J6Y85_01740 [Alphaproteobacteria bacterium]|nr:hypothetical protein [Alphaproteobacteria bacterium]
MYNKKHIETEIIETIQSLLPDHPELTQDVKNMSVDLSKYLPQDNLRFSTAKNIYDIPDDNVTIMRYMDYDKFQYLLKNASLYMPNPKRFTQDPNEGYLIPDAGIFIDSTVTHMYKKFHEDIVAKRVNISGINFTGIETIDRQIMRDRCLKIYKHNLKRFYVSCWTERDIDQDNMWKAYIAGDAFCSQEEKLKTAVAIKTTVKKLKQALRKNQRLFAITRAKYVNLETYKITNFDFLACGMWSVACCMLKFKNKPFEDDREIRLITDDLMNGTTQWYRKAVITVLGTGNFDYGAEPKTTALEIPIVLDDFIDEIIVSPFSNDNFVKELYTLLNSYGLKNVVIKKSDISKRHPCYWE